MTGEGSLFDIPPAAIGRFRVLHQVGAGTCGPVFRATDPELDRAVAIKLFVLNLTPERAATLAARLEHLVAHMPPLAAAVSPVAAGLHGHTPYLVTTFASGDSLDVALRQFGPAALEDLVPRLRALAGALDAAAGRGILHGALHPRDVLVSEHDTALTGLGVWPILAEMGVRLPARRPYRAPELTDASITASGDQFALASLAYEWMSGHRAPALFGLSDMAPLPGADRERMAHVFARALHPSPDHRYPSCAEFVSDVAEVAADAEPPVPAAGSRARRRPRSSAPALPLESFPSEAGTRDELLSPGSDEVVLPDAHPREEQEEVQGPTPPLAAANGDESDVTAGGMLESGPLAHIDGEPEPDGIPMRRSEPEMFANSVPPSPVSGIGRLVSAVLVGVVLGIFVGYAIWGRATSVDISTDQAVAAAPTEAQAPTSPSASPATGARGPVAQGVAPPDVVAPGQPQPSAGTEQTGSPAPAPRPPAATTSSASTVALSGSLLIRSTPAGATVFVDDEPKGVTPLALRELALGPRRVRVQRDGFTVENRQVTLTSGRPSRSLDVRLRRQAQAAPAGAAAAPSTATAGAKTGTLLIESRPSGAMALVNGRSVGATPVTIEDLAPGSYTVQLQLAGFRPLTTTVRVVAGARARAAASLTGAQEPK